MGRTLSTALANALDADQMEPRWLLRLGTIRIANGGNATGGNISWDSQTWTKSDFTVSEIENAGVVTGFTVKIRTTNALLSTFSGLDQDDVVELHATAALSSYTGNVVTIYDSTLGGSWSLKQQVFDFDVFERGWYPAANIGENSGLTEVTPPGNYTVPGGTLTVTLEKGF